METSMRPTTVYDKSRNVVQPLWWCSTCQRSTQRRNNAVNCYWCHKPYGEDSDPPELPSEFEEWWSSTGQFDSSGRQELAERAWNAAKEA